MPVVTVRSLRPADPTAVDRTLSGVVAGLAAAIGRDPAGVWAHWVPMERLFQGEAPRGYEDHCPVVTIRALVGRSDDQVAAGLAAAAAAVSAGLGVPLDDVWVHWVEVPPGRVFAGGAVRP